MLDDNREWISCFTDAVTFTSGHHLRILFSIALIHGEVLDLIELWEEFKYHFCDDLQYRLQVRGLDSLEIPHEMHGLHLDYELFLISEHLAAGGKALGVMGAFWLDGLAFTQPCKIFNPKVFQE